jgi:hypothetical protein
MKSFFKLDGHFIVSSPEENSLKIVDSVGRFILESEEAGVSNEIISKDISQAFSIPFDNVQRDVIFFLDQYHKNTIYSKSVFVISSVMRQASHFASCKNTQIVIFPSFTLKINHELEESLFLLRPFFSHLEVKSTSVIFSDYSLYIKKNKKQYWEIILDKDVLVSGEVLEDILIPALSHVLELAIRKDPYLILLHASGVTYNDDSIIFPAIGGSGKSTLCAALIKNGFGYINDDVIPVAYDSGELISIPFCLGIKQGSWDILEKYYPNISQKIIFGRNSLPVKYLSPPVNKKAKKLYKAKFLIIPCYKRGAKCIIERTSSLDGLKAIIEGESLIKLPLNDKDVEYLIAWVKNLECYILTYDNLDDAIGIIKKTLF